MILMLPDGFCFLKWTITNDCKLLLYLLAFWTLQTYITLRVLMSRSDDSCMLVISF